MQDLTGELVPLDIELRVSLHRGGRECGLSISSSNPETDDLLSMQVRPFFDRTDLGPSLSRALLDIFALVHEHEDARGRES